MTLSVAEQANHRYTVSGIIKGAASIEEIRALLHYWSPGESPLALWQRVREEGLLGKATAHRAEDLVLRVFRPRLLSPTDAPARHLKLFLELRGSEQAFRELLLIHEARAEAILYDFLCEKFWPACRTGALWLGPDDVLDFLDHAFGRGHIRQQWSAYTRKRVAYGLLAALTEFGFLRSTRPLQREIVPYRMSDAGLAYLAYDLHFTGRPDAAVVDHQDWCLFGLDRAHLLDRLDSLGPSLGLVVQRAGDVVRISWPHDTMEAVIHAIAR